MSKAMDVFPECGVDRESVMEALKATRRDDLAADGRAFGFAYDAGADVRDVAREAFATCMSINGLDPTLYPSARTLENDVVAACLAHLRAPEGAAGTATAGGTESILLAVKTARDYAHVTRPQVRAPKMLLPETAHASFHKAAHYYGVEVVPIGVDPQTMRADVADAQRKIDRDTILVVGSATTYSHGVIDPIAELAALAQEHGALMHVDGCIGAWVLPFQRELGIEQPAFDFTVEGVTSISMDLHKYAFAPKGISVLLQRRRDLRDAQYYACARWTGYAIVNSTTLGSKSLSALGAAWALLRYVGRARYRELIGVMWQAKQKVVGAVSEIDDLRVVGEPDMGLVALATDVGDVFALADRLAAKGWVVQPTYAFGASPAHVHLCLDPGNAAKIDQFIDDLRAAMVDLEPRQNAPQQLVQMLETAVASPASDAAAQGAASALAPAQLMAQLGVVDGRLPQQTALIHRVLDAASPALRERLLSLFVGELFDVQ